MTIETKPDLIEEVEALLANPKVFARSWYEGKQARDLLRRLVDENKRLRTQVTPKPQPKAGACVGRFAFRSDECTKCGLSRKDHE